MVTTTRHKQANLYAPPKRNVEVVIKRQRQLDIQQLDDNQRQRVEEFLAGKQIIDELRPEDFKKLSELGAGNWGVVSRVRHLTTGLIMAKKTIRLDIKHEVRTQIIRELEASSFSADFLFVLPPYQKSTRSAYTSSFFSYPARCCMIMSCHSLVDYHILLDTFLFVSRGFCLDGEISTSAMKFALTEQPLKLLHDLSY
ncbi:unnamed protein product [Dibothriocephalus latus]|uniref:mitogen-activated protein kinase kinase n=1 Tax=Dibothriocephalus latus TaxID=60516 RepID=A0A3P6Q7L3_DIBLA|nr:unnamed protein product [Dibothriocephalus latus]